MIDARLAEPRLAELSRELTEAGVPFALATVVYRKAPVSSHVGDKAIVTGDGRLFGWIGGSCSQPIVRREALAVIASGKPKLLRLAIDGDEAGETGEAVATVPMACPSGGEVSIYIEPHVTAPLVVAIGDTPVVRALARLAPVLDFEVTVVGAETPDLASLEFAPTAFVVVASAGHYDDEALLAALRSSVRYVALVASRRRAATVLEVLASYGVPREDLDRIHTPAGLDLGAVSQEEIALSILAEIVQAYRSPQREMMEHAGDVREERAPETARDPVCGMDVEIEGARHRAEHGGEVYYFCCPHCRMSFVKEPERYLAG
ncbi:MAG TPA: XdhC family protein [Candidatus Dormibacteraeota bacterium]|nr:XdhC family protein [Candidatus Dormibacteraeota bacterium]